jgi:hypothetical protein
VSDRVWAPQPELESATEPGSAPESGPEGEPDSDSESVAASIASPIPETTPREWNHFRPGPASRREENQAEQ